MQSYKDLEIYQLAHNLAVELHRATLIDLPKFEMYEEGSQTSCSETIEHLELLFETMSLKDKNKYQYFI